MPLYGYSGTPLSKKLGLKDGFTISVLNQPDYYFDLFVDLPEIQITKDKKLKKRFHPLFRYKRKNITEGHWRLEGTNSTKWHDLDILAKEKF